MSWDVVVVAAIGATATVAAAVAAPFDWRTDRRDAFRAARRLMVPELKWNRATFAVAVDDDDDDLPGVRGHIRRDAWNAHAATLAGRLASDHAWNAVAEAYHYMRAVERSLDARAAGDNSESTRTDTVESETAVALIDAALDALDANPAPWWRRVFPAAAED